MRRICLKAILAGLLMLQAGFALAGSWINTIGSDAGVAIRGFDVVAFHTQKRAVVGKPEFSHVWEGATWWFATAESLAQFKEDPQRWVPQYGGHCALGMSEGYVSKKPTSGRFDLRDGKLYLFPEGTRTPDGPYADWWRYGGPSVRIPKADANWLKLKSEAEALP